MSSPLAASARRVGDLELHGLGASTFLRIGAQRWHGGRRHSIVAARLFPGCIVVHSPR
jgi:hypothetical protein